jgi:hypothetical protein
VEITETFKAFMEINMISYSIYLLWSYHVSLVYIHQTHILYSIIDIYTAIFMDSHAPHMHPPQPSFTDTHKHTYIHKLHHTPTPRWCTAVYSWVYNSYGRCHLLAIGVSMSNQL